MRLALLLATLPIAHGWQASITAPSHTSMRVHATGRDALVGRRPVMDGGNVPPGMSPCSIKVIGVGGGGGNTLNRMVQEGPGVERSTFLEYVACNTDVQALSASLADKQVVLGKNQARGLGAGGVPAVGRASAIDASAELEDIVAGTDSTPLHGHARPGHISPPCP